MIIILSVITMVGIVLLSIWLFLQWISQSGQQAVMTRYAISKPLLVDYSVNCFGIESLGYFQIRGNGALALTEKELWFKAVLFSLELSIPVNKIKAVELVDSHLGKIVYKRKLLKIHFENETGKMDSVAFLLKDVALWQRTIEQETISMRMNNSSDAGI